jgi:hypothetical protein
MLASLPTYTQLGMASLLPNDELSIGPKTLCASVDGTDATGAQHREQILRAAVPGAAVLGYEDIFSQRAAEALSAAPLAYVYYNVIDMTGDKRDSGGAPSPQWTRCSPSSTAPARGSSSWALPGCS